MKPALIKKLSAAENRFLELEKEMATGQANWPVLAREHGHLAALVGHYRDWHQAQKNMTQLRTMTDNDADMKTLIDDEITENTAVMEVANKAIRQLLSPDASDNTHNCFLEIRAAVGGNESCLFASDLSRLYLRAADIHGWNCELISHSDGEVGGYKEIILRIIGAGAYGRLKFESGAHRVQRIPQTESQGRIHTSIVTVAVLLEPQEEDRITLLPTELQIDTFRSSGAGGQHVNTTDSAVRITHLPTGITAECQDNRSQHKNREKALSVLQVRIADRQRRERQAKEASQRRSLIGSGDRSDRIRTYNFPQGRLTDHRIGLTLYNLSAVMEGDINHILDALAKAEEEDHINYLEDDHINS